MFDANEPFEPAPLLDMGTNPGESGQVDQAGHAGPDHLARLPTRSELVADGSGVAEMDDFADAVDGLAGVDWTACGVDQLRDVLLQQSVLTARLSGVDVAILTAFENAAGGVRVHSRHVAAWLATNTGIPRYEANRRVLAARRLQSMHQTRAALERGDIHFAHAVALGKTFDKKHLAWAFELAEAEDLVPAAKTMHWRHFQMVVRKFEQTADPSQGENDADLDEARSEFKFSPTFEGNYRADGWFGPISGETIDAELKRLCAVLLEKDWAEARDRVGEHATIRDLARTHGQRMKDALVEMATRSAGARAGAVPSINVHVDYETLCQSMNELAGQPAAYPAEGIRETNAGAPISARQLAELSMEGYVRRIVFDSDGQILDFGQKKRFFTGELREAIGLRDRCCQHPGCDLPAVFCEADHITPFSRGGPTSIGNGQLLCGFHNRQKGDRYLQPWWDQTIDQLVWLTHPPI